jgi:predicted DNA-binding WGR domain protein
MSRREFHFQEGTSQKFWAIDVTGARFTVQFGRLGTAGQTQTKQLGSDQEAQKAADKLIAEKTKKGYKEVGSAASPSTVPMSPASTKAGKPNNTPAAEPPPAAAVSPLPITRQINLSPRDWLWATWRPRRPLPRPEHKPVPFDLGKCLKRFLTGVSARHGWWDWRNLRFDTPMTREEAHFWLRVVTSGREEKEPPKKVASMLEKERFSGQLSVQEVVDQLLSMKQRWPEQFRLLWQLLPTLLSAADLVNLIGDESVRELSWGMGGQGIDAVCENVFPFLSAEEIEPLKPLLRPRVAPQGWPANTQAVPAPEFFLAAALGMHDEMLAVVCGWPDGLYRAFAHYEPQRIVFGLGSGRLVETHMRRLGLRPESSEQVRAWLANTELGGLDLVRDAVLACGNKQEAERLIKPFCLVQAPEAASYMVELKISSKAAGPARQWLNDNPGNAIAGLIPVAAEKGKLADAAVEYLREARKNGASGFIEEQLKLAPGEVAAKVRQLVLEHEEKVFEPLTGKTMPKELREALAQLPSGTVALPKWLTLAALPPLLVGGRRFPDEQVLMVLTALRQSALGSPLPLLGALKQHADRGSLDAFTWRLFELWLAEGAPSKEKWALLAIGHLGGDVLALKLTPLLRAWPGESQHQRAVTGLECLRAMGTDTALMQLNGIAQKLKFQGLKKKAQEYMEAIAQDKGLTREELEDRIVPDLDLDERGTRVFDFGPRQFKVVLGPDLAPLVRDEAGKVKGDLPKPGARDDAAKASAAISDWKLLKKQLREALKVQAPRLELAMVTGRRWPVEQFETLLVRHPLMTNLARRVLWGCYDKGGKLAATIRVTEDQQLADVEDRPCTLKGIVSVGIVHPLHLTEEQRAGWGQVFGDYEIISPFPQLGRPVQDLDPKEAKAKTIQRLDKVRIPPLAVRGTLEKLGWARGSASDHGVVQEFFKHFPGAAVTAVLQVEPGIPMGMPDWIGDQNVERVFFLRGLYNPVAYPYHKEKDFLPLDQADPVAVSEVLADLAALGSKAK